jgi:hypothetical protein
VVAFKNRVPTTVPPLETIKDRVVEDYKRQESRTLAQQAGLDFQTKLTNAVAGGKSFEAAAKELGHAPVTLEPFNQTARSIGGADPRADISSIKNIAFALRENDTSSFTTTRDGGFILHVVKFVPVSDDALKTALPAYMSELRQTGQREAFGEWVNKEFQTAHLSLVTDKSNKNDKSAPTSDTQ